MTTYIKAYGPMNGPEYIHGEYLKAYDPEAFDGQGDVTFTDDPEKALTFENAKQAMVFAMRVPKKRPTRADGKPNRPLTAFTLEFFTR